MSGNPKIFAELIGEFRHGLDAAEHAITHAEHDVAGWFSPHRYHDHSSTATTEAPPMSLISTLEADAADLAAHVEEFISTKLPAATADLKKLEGNPVVDALLGAAHVPPQALDVVVGMINGLASLFPKPAAPVAAAPAEMVTEMVAEVPQPVPAGPVVAGQA